MWRQSPHRHDGAFADERIRISKCWPNPRQDHVGVLVKVAQPLGGASPHERVGVFEQRQQERHAHTGLRRVEVTQLVRRPGTVGGRECPEPIEAVVEWRLRSRGKSPSNAEQEQREATPPDHATSKSVPAGTWKPETHGSAHSPAYPHVTCQDRVRGDLSRCAFELAAWLITHLDILAPGGGSAVRPPYRWLEGAELAAPWAASATS